mgnify:CR=1 FL=1
MTLLIDTYNVLHVVGVLPGSLAGINVGGLAQLIAASRYHQKQTVLVCDGVAAPELGLPQQIEVVFSGGQLSADEVIVARVCSASHPRQIQVVTSDRAIQRAVRRRKAKVINSPTFLKQLVHDFEKTRAKSSGVPNKTQAGGPLSDTAIEAWAKYLDIDLEQFDISELAPPNPLPRAAAPKTPETKPKHPPAPRKHVVQQPDFPADVLAEAKRLLEEDH